MQARERRVKRSSHPITAARLFLADLAEKHGLSAVILATENGQLVTGSEMMAYQGNHLMAPIEDDYGKKLARIAQGAAEDAERAEQEQVPWMVEGPSRQRVWSSKVAINGEFYYLASVGFDGGAAQAVATETITGVSRIFSTAA
ncbi:MAG: hypothetical protein VYA34_11075 [Myxococcota bacterium]|nr:hypothetical protein [Myxococcota bacterium]